MNRKITDDFLCQFKHLFKIVATVFIASCATDVKVIPEPPLPKMYEVTRTTQSVNSKNKSKPNSEGGIVLNCQPRIYKTLLPEIKKYFKEQNIDSKLFNISKGNIKNGVQKVQIALHMRYAGLGTIVFPEIQEFNLHEESVQLPALNNKSVTVNTVSKKEILLAMMQRGRETVFDAETCNLESIQDFVGVRQNTAAWGESLDWYFPNGPARWNTKYWDHGTPLKTYSLHESLTDVFINPNAYAFGCYTAAKMLMMQGAHDYFARVNPNPEKLKKVEDKLWSNNDPLVDLEPGRTWSFEKNFEVKDLEIPGKILNVQFNIPARHIIPGDWIYILNPDEEVAKEAGYEGSNAIYLGRNRFTDYYNINKHYYSFEALLDKVYQWRHKVFARPSDNDKIKPIDKEQLLQLAKTPDYNGLFFDFRVYHQLF